MSGRLVGEVLDNAPADLTQLEILVLVALAESARDTDRVARFQSSSDALADRARSTPGAVRNALQRLRGRGLLVPLIDRPRRGQAQQYLIPKMNESTRRSIWKASPGSDAK